MAFEIDTSKPLVSVVMSVFNGAEYLRVAIESILTQTFTNFEFIIINDGSTDNSEDIVLSFKDSRIKYHLNEQNIGLTKSLNKGIRLSKGNYIARMDADDIAYPNRFEEQVNYLEKHQQCGVCGTNIKLIDAESNLIRYHEYPNENKELKTRLLIGSIFVHPTVMIRKSTLTDYSIFYNETYSSSQDYDLWVQLAQYCDFSTIQNTLLDYRIHDNSISISKKESQFKNHRLIQKDYILRQLSAPSNKIERLLDELLQLVPCTNLYQLGQFKRSLQKELIATNNFNQLRVQIIIKTLWKEVVAHYPKQNLKTKLITRFFS
jgi:glycosyltransferase involved in cell wall biosynthesis